MRPEALIARATNLRAPSPTVVRLLSLLNNPNADYLEVIETVRRDSVLSAKLLALCNSASYGLAQPVASIEQCVHFLGYCEIHRLVMALNFGGQIGAELPGYAMEAGSLWRHSLVTALLTPRVVAMSRKFGADTSIAYTAGLLHDIGKLVIGQAIEQDLCDRIREVVEGEGAAVIEAEKSVLGCDHAEIGACLLRQWRIPEVIVEAVASHHAPPLKGGPRLSAVVRVADAIAHQTGASPGWESFAIHISDDLLPALGLVSDDLDEIAIAAIDEDAAIRKREVGHAGRTAKVAAVESEF